MCNDVVAKVCYTLCLLSLSHTTHLLTHLYTHTHTGREVQQRTDITILVHCSLNIDYSGQRVRAGCPLTFTWLRIFPRRISMRLTHGDFGAVRLKTARKSCSIVRISPSSR